MLILYILVDITINNHYYFYQFHLFQKDFILLLTVSVVI